MTTGFIPLRTMQVKCTWFLFCIIIRDDMHIKHAKSLRYGSQCWQFQGATPKVGVLTDRLPVLISLTYVLRVPIVLISNAMFTT